jgi:D-alanyl-D-alanine carboxypeptidase
MNNLGKKCGMKSSKFCNPHGLPHAQSCSNAEDLAILMA